MVDAQRLSKTDLIEIVKKYLESSSELPYERPHGYFRDHETESLRTKGSNRSELQQDKDGKMIMVPQIPDEESIRIWLAQDTQKEWVVLVFKKMLEEGLPPNIESSGITTFDPTDIVKNIRETIAFAADSGMERVFSESEKSAFLERYFGKSGFSQGISILQDQFIGSMRTVVEEKQNQAIEKHGKQETELLTEFFDWQSKIRKKTQSFFDMNESCRYTLEANIQLVALLDTFIDNPKNVVAKLAELFASPAREVNDANAVAILAEHFQNR